VRALTTKYNNHLFRSRLEARWAKFFDYLDISYLYELEGFDLGSAGFYLPDFFLPGIPARNFPQNQKGIWKEIKPFSPDGIYREKLESLVEYTHCSLILLTGQVNSGIDSDFEEYRWDGDEKDGGIFWDSGMCWYKCYECGKIKIDYGYKYNICPFCGGHSSPEHPDITTAVKAALSARFEK